MMTASTWPNVVSAADGRGTIYDLLDGRYVIRYPAALRGRTAHPLPGAGFVGRGAGSYREPHWVTYLLDEPVIIAGLERNEIGVKHYCFDPILAPPGKSAVEVMLESPYGYWQRIYGRKLYDTEQSRSQIRSSSSSNASILACGQRRGDRRGDAAQLRALHR